jgi:hypothetical protein
MSPTSAHDLNGILDISILSMENAVTELPSDHDLPAYLWVFWDNKKFTFKKWHDLGSDALYDEVRKAILELRPDAICLITTGWASVPSFPGMPSEDPQRADAVNFVVCDNRLRMTGAMMKLRQRKGSREVKSIIRTDELAGVQVEQVKTAMLVAHQHSDN